MNIQRSPLKGAHGWAILAGLIVAIDLTAPPGETLSESCWAWIKRNPTTTILVVAATALHLLLGWDPRYSRIDAFQALALVRSRTGMPITATGISDSQTNTPETAYTPQIGF